MHFNPADVQTVGIGLAAFLSTLILVFIFLTARKETLGRALLFLVGTAVIWSWFGFLYEIVSNVTVARELRIISVMGIVWIGMAFINFSVAYFSERTRLDQKSTRELLSVTTIGILLSVLLMGDLFGGRLIVGELLLPTNEVLAPTAGPFFGFIVGYYALCIFISGVLLALRARASKDKSDRRKVELISASLIIALVLGGTRFTPWYGFVFEPLISALGTPLFTFAVFYTIKRYNILNMEVAIAQILIFALWTFTFFRMLVSIHSPTFIFDVGFFIAVFILGIFLLQSMVSEMHTQKKLAHLTIEEVKSEFATIAAHELRIPFATIRSTFSHLSSGDGGTLSEAQHNLVREGNNASNRLISILDNLLNVVHISRGTLRFDIEPGDLRDAVRSSTNILLEGAQKKNIQLNINLPSQPLKTRFDRGKLAFAIEIAVDNAIKYTHAGGSISVRALKDGIKNIVTVTDTGIGIPQSEQERIFEKFFRGESASQLVPDGSGLGLYLAKSIIEGQSGSISVSSGADGGTTVTISLPAII